MNFTLYFRIFLRTSEAAFKVVSEMVINTLAKTTVPYNRVEIKLDDNTDEIFALAPEIFNFNLNLHDFKK